MSIRVAIYIRVSSEGQVNDESGKRIEDGSLEVQKNRAIAHVKTQCQSLGKDYEICYVIEDAGKSAKNTNREGYQKLLQIIDEGKIDWVVTSELSRLNRNTLDYLLFKKHCLKNNVQIIYVGTAYRENDDVTDLMETVLAASAEFERKITAQRIKRNIKSRLITDGKINGVSAILGLDRCAKRRGHFVVNESERLDLINVLELYLQSSSLSETLERLDEAGIKDKGGVPFTMARIRTLLMNVEWRYSGLWFCDDVDSSGERQNVNLDHGPLIEEELRNRVVEKRSIYALKKSRCGKRNHIYLLSNLLKGTKGESFSGHIGHGRNEDYRYYYSKNLKIRLNATRLEDLIERRIIKYFKDSSIFRNLVSKALDHRDSKIEILKRDLVVLKKDHVSVNDQVTTLVKRLSNPNLSDAAIETVAKQITELEKTKKLREGVILEHDVAIKELQALKGVINIQDKVEKYANDFQKLNRVQKKILLEGIFDKIEVVDEYSVNLHIKKAPSGGAFLSSLTKSCDSELIGGSTGT